MAEKGEQTRERILATAEPMILRQGFAGTSLDDILKATKLTKGAFFHHFNGKGDLARALVERYARNDYSLFERFAAEAESASADPLQQTMLFLKSFEDFIEGLAEPVGGCIFAAYTYESLQFDPAIHAFIAHSLRRWTALYEKKFEAVLARYKPARPVTARDLADMVVALIEGGFILSRSYNDATIVARQSRQFRQYLELLFPE
ncbi:MAG: TetR/AcrR family transcriptional regulator [Pseudorhodoplanes sp.]|jgi:TetR/AcrR family transcriptional repressor of nem operon|nr:TetR/AcrR family transcriptional regulator [Pseudorhodoplanes sp.]